MNRIPKNAQHLGSTKKEQKTVELTSLAPAGYKELALTYVSAGNGAGEVETVKYYKEAGAVGLLRTVTIAYDGSDRISTVTIS